jgi:hypothetical protein
MHLLRGREMPTTARYARKNVTLETSWSFFIAPFSLQFVGRYQRSDNNVDYGKAVTF